MSLLVTQADRDAACLAARLTGWTNVANRIERGWVPERGTAEAELIETFARHRINSTPPTPNEEVERLAILKWLHEADFGEDFLNTASVVFADAIENGEHLQALSNKESRSSTNNEKDK